MKLSLLIILLLCFHGYGKAQPKPAPPAKTSVDTLTTKVFKKILNRQFSNLLTGQTKNSIGNYASIDLKEPEVSFSGSSIFKNGSVLTIKASGGITDGFFAIFNNSTLNTGIALDVQYNFLRPKVGDITYDTDSVRVYMDKDRKIKYEYTEKMAAMRHEQGKTSLVMTKNKLEAQKKELEKEWSKDVKPRKDSLAYAIEMAALKIDSLDVAIKNYPPKKDVEDKVNNWKGSELKKNKPEFGLDGFNLRWFSIGYKVQSNSFKLFDPGLPSGKQTMDSSFVGHEGRFQYSQYKWSKEEYESFFWCAGLAVTYTNNLGDLDKLEITEIKNYGAIPNERTTTDKFNAYTGQYNGGKIGLKLYGDYYQFLFSENAAAFHIYPELKIKEGTKPVSNIGLGFLYCYKDEKDETSIVNAELYYNFQDIFNTGETSYKILERNKVGLRFTFPIKFKTK